MGIVVVGEQPSRGLGSRAVVEEVVHVVAHHDQVVPPGQLDDLAALLGGHDGPGRVVERGDGVEHCPELALPWIDPLLVLLLNRFLKLGEVHPRPVRGHGYGDGRVTAVLFQYVQRDEVRGALQDQNRTV